jgi:hypothetical protein
VSTVSRATGSLPAAVIGTGRGAVTAGDEDSGGIGRVSPTWSSLREAFGVVTCRRNLARSLLTALVVGTVLFSINQLDVVLRGQATTLVWFKAGLTYCVPFAVSNVGILIGTHRRP